MRIGDLIRRKRPVFSFELFPPKSEQGERSLLQTIDRLHALEPDFVSVTYGAGGSTREKTIELVTLIRRRFGIETMAHLTCVGHDRNEIAAILDRLHDQGVENVMALRGDPPRGETAFVRPANGFGFASELVSFIRESRDFFSIGGAGYPEGHVECPDRDEDLRHLRDKVDAGLDFVVTQLFFDNADYFRFLDRALAIGIGVPIVPGIMPITNFAQIDRFTKMCGARIPDDLRSRLGEVAHDEAAVRRIGIEHSVAQCRELIARGAPGIHFYTLNQSPATASILAALRS